jgi:hypothetical protein
VTGVLVVFIAKRRFGRSIFDAAQGPAPIDVYLHGYNAHFNRLDAARHT